MPRDQLLAATFMELADTLDDEFEVLGFLQNLTQRSTEILNASAAGLVLADQRGELQQVASTSHTARVLGVIALSISQGPAQEAFRTGDPIINVPSSRAASRWPRFMAAATELGFRSVHVFPLRHRNEVLGALSLFFEEPTQLSGADTFIGSALVRVATIGLLQERTPRQKEILAERLQSALAERVLLEQAKGVVAERADVTVEQAFELMLRYARAEARQLSDVARSVVDGSLGPHSLLE